MASKKVVVSVLILTMAILLPSVMAVAPSGGQAEADSVQQTLRTIIKREADSVQQKLGKKIKKVQYMENPLSEVMDDLRVRSGLNIVTNWQSLTTWGIEKNRPITLELHDVTVKTVLRVILDKLGGGSDSRLGYVVDENVITISTIEDLRDAAEAAVRLAKIAEFGEEDFPAKRVEQIEMKLGLIERLQEVCFDPAAAGLIATAGLKDDVSRERPEIIEDLETQLGKTKSLGLRNALHLALRDLYKADGNNKKVLEHLRAMLAENDAAMAKREAPKAAQR